MKKTIVLDCVKLEPDARCLSCEWCQWNGTAQAHCCGKMQFKFLEGGQDCPAFQRYAGAES